MNRPTSLAELEQVVPYGRKTIVILGSLATIGRKAAVAEFGFVKLWEDPRDGCGGMVNVGVWPERET
jgi:hypothetical protein